MGGKINPSISIPFSPSMYYPNMGSFLFLSYHFPLSEHSVNVCKCENRTVMGISLCCCPKTVSDLGLRPMNQEGPSQLELSFAAKRKLVQSSTMSQSNDCKLLLVVFDGEDTTERTEVLTDNSGTDVSWSTTISVTFVFGAKNSLVFQVYRVDQPNPDLPVQLEDQALLVEHQLYLSQIVTETNRTYTCYLEQQNRQASCQIAELTIQAGSYTGAFLDHFPVDGYLSGMFALDYSSSNFLSCMKVAECFFKGIEPYASDRHYAAWAFGGKTTINGKTSTCFNLNLKSDSPVIYKVQGIVEASQNFQKQVESVANYDRNTLIEVIKKASDFVENSEECCHKYHVWLIITDEVLFHPKETMDSLVNASKLPMSILVVCVGGGKSVERMKKHIADNALGDTVRCISIKELPTDEQSMGKALLKEIPKQYCEYRQKRLQALLRDFSGAYI